MIVKSLSDIPTDIHSQYTKGNYSPLKPFVYLVVSDIHLGKKSVPARYIIDQLTVFFKNLEKSTPVNMIFIAGDLFDQALSFTADDVTHILQWARSFFKFCAKNRIALRMMEGTPSHDRRQMRNLIPLAKSTTNLNFEYIPTMCVEYFEDFGVTCLYVPDEFGGSAAESQRLIQEKLSELQLPKVGMAIVHGMFTYQVPMVPSDRYKYNEQFFLDAVDGFVHIGHIHTRSVYQRIIAQGSFGRIAHGEEEAKGCSLVYVEPGGELQEFFVENKEATKFLTIRITFNDVDKASDQLTKKLVGVPDFSHIRIRAPEGHVIFNVLDHFKKEYMTLTFSKITEKEAEKAKLIDETLLSAEYTPIHIDKQNIVSMILDRVKLKQDIQGSSLQKLENKLKELV